jgi:hypothetical protein
MSGMFLGVVFLLGFFSSIVILAVLHLIDHPLMHANGILILAGALLVCCGALFGLFFATTLRSLASDLDVKIYARQVTALEISWKRIDRQVSELRETGIGRDDLKPETWDTLIRLLDELRRLAAFDPELLEQVNAWAAQALGIPDAPEKPPDPDEP